MLHFPLNRMMKFYSDTFPIKTSSGKVVRALCFEDKCKLSFEIDAYLRIFNEFSAPLE